MNKAEIKAQTAIKTTTKVGRNRIWIVRLLGLFLLLAQGAGLILWGIYYFKPRQNTLQVAQPGDISNVVTKELQLHTVKTGVDAKLYKSIFNPIGILIGLSAFAFFLRFRSGWLCALLLQGAILYISISLYFSDELIPIIYPIMLYGIFMVLFLNAGAVRKVFLPRLKQSNE
jgi:hypothetical protein